MPASQNYHDKLERIATALEALVKLSTPPKRNAFRHPMPLTFEDKPVWVKSLPVYTTVAPANTGFTADVDAETTTALR